MPRVRFSVVRHANNQPFTFIDINTNVRLWKTDRRLQTFSKMDNPYAPDGKTWICEGQMTLGERATLMCMHPRTEFEFKEEVPQMISEVYDVAYAHRHVMRYYGFLKKKEPEVEGGRPRWYYLIPYVVSDEEVERVLKDSASVQRGLRH